MSLEKLTCCLAHPMTALRTLKEKINEVVDAVNNLPAGGGGGGGSLIVGVTSYEWTDESNKQAMCVLDKSFADTLAAIKDGLYVTLRGNFDGMGVFPVVMYSDELIVFGLYTGSFYVQLIFMVDGTAIYMVE